MKKSIAVQMLVGSMFTVATAAAFAAGPADGFANSAQLNAVQPGETKADVLSQLGTPERTITWPGSRGQTLFYDTDATPNMSAGVAHVDIDGSGRVVGVDVSMSDAEE